ncbi:GFA family protein [Erythrobacter crassostreae]|uniref:GFA family protein n=1 Tax=Erythrobacter crassostreae TaxID=2828328 RepID=A0A9X1F4U2_9SPHN|nr:GFA family protein [Erythrobacter crassostrea]
MADEAEGFGKAVSSNEFTGGCQCGAVRYQIKAESLVSYACHCRECQKQSASAFGISVPVWKASVTVVGDTGVWRRPTDSGSHTDCHYCKNCGTRVCHAGANRPGMITIKGGSLDSALELQPVAHIWTASKQGWVVLPVGIPQWERQPTSQEEWITLLT